MNDELPKRYDPLAVEKAVAERWRAQGYSNPDNLPERHREPFVVMMPPPNVTGSLHMGHALEAALTDCLVRFKRMRGYRTLYLPGMDHAGIATQNVVEKTLQQEGKTRHDLGREEFLKRVWAWKEQYGGIILEQFRRIGVSADWSRERFTMDEHYTRAVEEAFRRYQEKGWIYKGTRVINWCPRCATSLSDLEVKYVPERAKLYYIRYGPFTLATVRPETKLGDTALAVHPEDARYAQWIGKTIDIESVDNNIPREESPRKKTVQIQVVADDAVDPAFGTGIIKVTPAHDITDFEIGQRHGLPSIMIIDEHARMNENAGARYRDMAAAEARAKIADDLAALDLIEKVDDYEHNIARCDRCGSIVEPIPSQQWFLKMAELAEAAADAYRSENVRIAPERWLHVALERLAHERDWCISRQLWWGHRVPVQGETDVLDTWFSSALWPFATLGWPDATKDLIRYYPTQWMTSAREILFLWINRMIFSGSFFMGKTPFTEVFIHPTVLTKEGKRMSKSLGTGIDPLALIEREGADALRFGLLWQLTGAQDIRFDDSAIVAGRKFLTKTWNATRYVLGRIGETAVPSTAPEPEKEIDQAILRELAYAVAAVEEHLEALRFGQALERFYEFFWHAFCDKYLEATKKREDEQAKLVLLWVLSASLRVLHPFIPFATDELWEKLPHQERTPLTIAPWPDEHRK
ncbi:MAG: hypothetical protein A2991_01620 [Candidatus Terrybacteria bacterium RIFCSPLOWO2_01_FULL_58_14]|uniref:valine--tRNA ligase n=1 Tax=Candidatus Terrybacteria bacterium RIFCSPLOWO2_01_FULL_58_14 TaxID=1802369 RepID=A0A1G2PY48_9BACT|nr:MAG: hypothetical protein A2991_01620 [Candidatus Terrybacteria bacterium RIFCSPLOWO2_01_FULL_58_14]